MNSLLIRSIKQEQRNKQVTVSVIVKSIGHYQVHAKIITIQHAKNICILSFTSFKINPYKIIGLDQFLLSIEVELKLIYAFSQSLNNLSNFFHILQNCLKSLDA